MGVFAGGYLGSFGHMPAHATNPELTTPGAAMLPG